MVTGRNFFEPLATFCCSLVRYCRWYRKLYVPALSPATYADRLIHVIEHATIFLLAGLAFGIGYPNQIVFSFLGLGTYTLGVEIAQLSIPGRHARVSDFLVDIIAVSVGLCMGTFAHRASN